MKGTRPAHDQTQGCRRGNQGQSCQVVASIHGLLRGKFPPFPGGQGGREGRKIRWSVPDRHSRSQRVGGHLRMK